MSEGEHTPIGWVVERPCDSTFPRFFHTEAAANDLVKYVNLKPFAVASPVYKEPIAGWQPIETAPKDTIVEVWHRTWGCPVAARYISGNANATYRWVEKTLTTQWPDEAFSHWRPLSAPPVEAKSEVVG